MCCKLREWVWTETGKGDRLGGDNGLSPSPPSERPAPPHSLHRTSRTIPDAGQLHMPDWLCYSSWSAFAMPRLPASAITPCLLPYLHCPCVTITMCARTIQQAFCQDCPAGSHTRGLHLSSPCIHHLVLSFVLAFCPSIHEEPGTALSSRLPRGS